MTWAALVKLGLQLPGVEEGPWYGTPGLKVGGKGFVRLKDETVAVFVLEDVDAQQFLINALPRVYFITEHYRGWPAVLARLNALTVKEAKARLRHGWQQKAPPKLLKGLR
jgi:hypothetical protein